jgi:CheY-like chemotaxis protein
MSHTAPKVLIIEEDPLVADITSFRLELLGYRVESISSGEAAHEAIASEAPDVIILDMYLPDMSGHELAARFAAGESTSKIPIVAFSTSADLDDVKKAYAVGVKDYVVKPYDPLVLEQKLLRLLETAGKSL